MTGTAKRLNKGPGAKSGAITNQHWTGENTMTTAFVFPGQGSQEVGMGQDLAAAYPVARQVFEEVDEALGQKLSAIMANGPEEDLRLTENAQPALMAVSVAVALVIQAESGKTLAELASHVAGHSLGEYSALTAAGSLDLADCARLLKQRGQAMQQAVPVGLGAMAALLGLSLEDAVAAAGEAAEGQICSAANDNAVGQVVVSGDAQAVERAIEIAKEKGARRAMMLPVSAPFHCALMQPAAEVMAAALASIEINTPAVPLVANVTAAAETDTDRIRGLLVDQVTSMVRWRESVLFLKTQGVDHLTEIGAGKVLSTMTRRIDREISASAIGTPADIDAFLQIV